MKLLNLTACEKVIQDPSTGPSLIATFQTLTIHFPKDTEVPNNAVAPKEWVIFSTWELDSDNEIGKTFALQFEVLWPDGTMFAKQRLEAADKAKDWITFIVKLQGFPVGQPGDIKIRVWLERGEKIYCGPFETRVVFKIDRTLAPAAFAGA